MNSLGFWCCQTQMPATMVNCNHQIKSHDLKFWFFHVPKTNTRQLVMLRNWTFFLFFFFLKLDFLIANNTNELGPQVQKVLNEIASWDYESHCSTIPKVKVYVYGVLPLGHLDKLPFHSMGLLYNGDKLLKNSCLFQHMTAVWNGLFINSCSTCFFPLCTWMSHNWYPLNRFNIAFKILAHYFVILSY